MDSRSSRRICQLLDDLRGVSAIEFAFILPLMLTIYIGTFEVSQGVSAMRKVTLTAHTIADLVSRQTSVSSMSDYFAASATIMAPFTLTSSNFTMIVSQVMISSNGTATIQPAPNASGTVGSCAYNTTAYSTGQTVTVPSALIVPNTTTYLIWGQASFTYSPFLVRTRGPFYTMSGPITLSDQMYLSPRMTSCVQLTC